MSSTVGFSCIGKYWRAILKPVAPIICNYIVQLYFSLCSMSKYCIIKIRVHDEIRDKAQIRVRVILVFPFFLNTTFSIY